MISSYSPDACNSSDFRTVINRSHCSTLASRCKTRSQSARAVVSQNCNRMETRSSAVAVTADRTGYDVRYTCTIYWKTIKPVSVTSWRTIWFNGQFMNAPKLNPLKRDWPKIRRQWITERNTTSAPLIVCRKKTHVPVFFDFIFFLRSFFGAFCG